MTPFGEEAAEAEVRELFENHTRICCGYCAGGTSVTETERRVEFASRIIRLSAGFFFAISAAVF
jgi:hypothetical protein